MPARRSIGASLTIQVWNLASRAGADRSSLAAQGQNQRDQAEVTG